MSNTYNTSDLPLGTTDVRALYNNASNLDDAANGAASSWADRFGKSRKSWAGIEADFKSFLLASGYELIGDYVTNSPLTITRPNQIFSRSGEYYRAGPSLVLPYTTVANWTIDGPKFVSTGDAAVRAAMAAANGSSLVGFQRSRLANQILTVQDILSTGTVINILEYANLAVGYTMGGDHTSWDWQPALQAAMNALVDGDELWVPGWLDLKSINATGSGANIVVRRASAVAGGTLKAITCSRNSITFRCDGRIRFTSALDDGIRLSGTNCRRTGNGTLQGIAGEFLDTNSSDPLQQWLPSLLVMSGDGSRSEGGTYIDAPTVGLRLIGNRQYSIYDKFSGGPTSHGTGTIQFGVYLGTPIGGTYGHRVIGGDFRRSTGGGAPYSGVFGVSAESWISECNFEGMWEHGVYNYGAEAKITRNIVDGTGGGIAAGIQSFAPGVLIEGCTVRNNAGGGIAVQIADRVKILNNNCWENIGLSAVSVRTYFDTDINTIMEDLLIQGNLLAITGATRQAAIDIVLSNGFRNLKILDNTGKGGPIPGVSGLLQAGILVRVLPGSPNAGVGLKVAGNDVSGCDGWGLVVFRVQDGDVLDNRFTNCNGLTAPAGTGSIPMGIFSSGNIRVMRNVGKEIGRTPICTSLLSALSSDLNSGIRAENNDIINFAGSNDPICFVPTDSLARFNTVNTLPVHGFVTMPNAASSPFSAAGIRGTATQVVVEPMGKIAVDQQAGAARVYVSGVAAGIFTMATSNAAASGANPVYKWEACQ